MDLQSDTLIRQAFARQLENGADAGQIARSVRLTWGAIEDGLCPVLGRGGVGALYKRSLFLAARDLPWLASHWAATAWPDPDALAALLGQRTSVEAADVATAVLEAFQHLLTKLVGPALTERLLRSSWSHLSIAPAAQDTPQ